MARRPSGPIKDDNPNGTKGRNVTRRAGTGPARCFSGKKTARKKKKRPTGLEELAKKLNIPRSTMYQYAKQGKIPRIKIGRRYGLPTDVEERFRSSAYEKWAARTGNCNGYPQRGPMEGVWLSPRQFARQFGVGTSAVYGAIERGELPAIRLGRHIRIPPDAVEVILRQITKDNQETSSPGI
jgi:excisionase family DNA binding protein